MVIHVTGSTQGQAVAKMWVDLVGLGINEQLFYQQSVNPTTYPQTNQYLQTSLHHPQPPCALSPHIDQIQVVDSSVMRAEGIFQDVLQAIKTCHPNLFVRDNLDQKGFEHIRKCIRKRMAQLETYSFR